MQVSPQWRFYSAYGIGHMPLSHHAHIRSSRAPRRHFRAPSYHHAAPRRGFVDDDVFAMSALSVTSPTYKMIGRRSSASRRATIALERDAAAPSSAYEQAHARVTLSKRLRGDFARLSRYLCRLSPARQLLFSPPLCTRKAHATCLFTEPPLGAAAMPRLALPRATSEKASTMGQRRSRSVSRPYIAGNFSSRRRRCARQVSSKKFHARSTH